MSIIAKSKLSKASFNNATETSGGNVLGAIESQTIKFPIFAIEKGGKPVLSLSMLKKEGFEAKEILLANGVIVVASVTATGNYHLPQVETNDGLRWFNPTSFLSKQSLEDILKHVEKRDNELVVKNASEALPEGASLGWVSLQVSRTEGANATSSVSFPKEAAKTKTSKKSNTVPA